MIPNLAVQEIHDTLATHRNTDWHGMWRQRGDRLMKLAAELEEMTRQRDMLATRCAEQAKQIAQLTNPYKQRQLGGSIEDAIAVMEDNRRARR